MVKFTLVERPNHKLSRETECFQNFKRLFIYAVSAKVLSHGAIVVVGQLVISGLPVVNRRSLLTLIMGLSRIC